MVGGRREQDEMRRIGFEATARLNRHDHGVSRQDELPGGGVVVSNEIELFLAWDESDKQASIHGASGTRTRALSDANRTLSQLSYGPRPPSVA